MLYMHVYIKRAAFSIVVRVHDPVRIIHSVFNALCKTGLNRAQFSYLMVKWMVGIGPTPYLKKVAG